MGTRVSVGTVKHLPVFNNIYVVVLWLAVLCGQVCNNTIVISKKHQGPTDVSSISGAVLINDNVINIKRGQDNHDIPVTIAVPGAVLPNVTHRH